MEVLTHRDKLELAAELIHNVLNWFLGSAWEPRSRGSASLGDRRGRASRRHS